MESKTKLAVKILTSQIRNDPGLRESYKANIAMAFYDECVRMQEDHEMPLELLHHIANKAADNFLNLWCS